MSDHSTHSLDASHRIQEKYDFYILALTFTIVGFAIQTQPESFSLIGKIAELLSWLFLILSGITGIFRIEKQYELYQLAHHQYSRSQELVLFKQAQRKGVSEIEYVQAPPKKSILPVRDEVIEGLQEGIIDVNSRIGKRQFNSKILFYLQKSLFLLGLLSIMIARGIKPFLEILNSV